MQQYAIITANYWAFTLTDGALRMLVVLHFHTLGFSPLEIAFLFIFYEFFGVVTNLMGGWLGARLGLNRTMQLGLGLQVVALAMLLVPAQALTLAWVMAAQALSGIAKDLNKMSAKSAVKLLVPENANARLYRLIALLTGSKNALKGAGFFLGGMLLSFWGFQGAVLAMAIALVVVWLMSFFLLKAELGKAKTAPKFSNLLSKSAAINTLSAARFCLFAARDVWFVIALPLHLASNLEWQPMQVSGFLAVWIIGYGFVQTLAPRITGVGGVSAAVKKTLGGWAMGLALITALLALLVALATGDAQHWLLLGGLLLFGGIFAVNSSLHSYAIVGFASADAVSLDVGFYYMANAAGRLAGTLLSGWLALSYGLVACLAVSALLLFATVALSMRLPESINGTENGLELGHK